LRVGGHRGSSAAAPENTYAAFERALADSAAFVETDIRRTSDGALVLMHDPTVERTTDGRGPIAALSLLEVRGLDAGAWFGDEFRGQRVPEFGDFLRWIEQRPAMGAALEVKSADTGAQVAEQAWSSPARERLAIYSFSAAEIRAAKAARPQVPCVLLLELTQDPAAVIAAVDDAGADGADVPWQWNARELIDRMRQRGMIVGGGSATGDQAADRLLDLGVDMIDTDQPAAMLAAVQRLSP
jgi:glycerophosphoryl diester phosphodiesterase